MTVEEFLAGVESRLTAATPGPWEQDRHEVYGPAWLWVAETDDLNRPDLAKGNAALIAAAPSDLAKLTAAIRNILDLHGQGDHWCGHEYAESPCSTVRAITDALEDTS